MSMVQRLMGTRPDGVIRGSETAYIVPGMEGKSAISKWQLYWGEHIPGQEVDRIMLADGEGSSYS